MLQLEKTKKKPHAAKKTQHSKKKKITIRVRKKKISMQKYHWNRRYVI